MFRLTIFLSTLGVATSLAAQRPALLTKRPLNPREFIASSKEALHRRSRPTVADSLYWIDHQQLLDGGWSYRSATAGLAKPGAQPSRVEATALVLLAQMGAGRVHREGEHAAIVHSGLAFLGSQMKLDAEDGSVDARGSGGDLRAHALSTLVMCQLYAKTEDADLEATAQGCLSYLIKRQDAKTGGWHAGQNAPPSLATHVWAVMALYSGEQAGLLDVSKARTLAMQHVEARRLDDGPFYKDSQGKKSALATAQALVCRQYLGDPLDTKRAAQSIKYLVEQGPARHDAQYDLLVTLLLFRHQLPLRHQGETWWKWNAVLRDRVVAAQHKTGFEAGSWYDEKDRNAARGGQLYLTAVHTLTQEVYYQHLPLFLEMTHDE